MKERSTESHFGSAIIEIDADNYIAHLDSLLATAAWKELLVAFSFNMQSDMSDQTQNAYGLLDGPIPLDPSIDADSLYRLGLIDRMCSTVSKFGIYVVESLNIDANELAKGNFSVSRRDD